MTLATHSRVFQPLAKAGREEATTLGEPVPGRVRVIRRVFTTIAEKLLQRNEPVHVLTVGSLLTKALSMSGKLRVVDVLNGHNRERSAGCYVQGVKKRVFIH